jgi:transglutaminase-like putative cysteine protease
MLNKLSTLPRDSRDALFLLAVIAWVILPQLNHLPLWCSLSAAAMLLWRAHLAWSGQPLPRPRWLLVLLALAIAATLMTHRTLLGRDAGVTMIVVLLALKTLELRARRDAFVVFFLGLFTMLTNFFFSQSLLTAAAMLVALLGLLTMLVNTHMPVGKPPLLQVAKTAGGMALLGAPIMVLLFVLFPRLAPLWGLPADALTGRSGLSAQMQVGHIANLALDNSIAMRIRFEGAAPPQSALYFRGPVLGTFDGREWRALKSVFPPRMRSGANLQAAGEPIKYEITLEPNQRPWVFVLDAALKPPELPGFELGMTPELQWLANRPISELVRYQAQSYTTFRHGPLSPIASLREYVDLPAGFNPRTLQLAANIRRDPRYATAEPAVLVDLVLQMLKTGGYLYTLAPGTFGRDSADEFWFDKKAGFCEHIASSFVLLMRALDIPARIVTGYQGGERNSVDNFWVIRQSDAHAWTEVWMPGRGWVRVDPTTAVAPGRTGTLQRLQPPQGAIASVLGTVSPELALSLRAVWDAMNNGWNQWVLNYTQARQLNLLKNLGFTSPGWEDLGYVLIGSIVLLSLCGAAWTLWERRRQAPWQRLLKQVARRLQQAGVVLAPHASPRQMAQRLREQRGNEDNRVRAIEQWLLQLEAQHYAPHDSRHPGLRALQREFNQLTWPK